MKHLILFLLSALCLFSSCSEPETMDSDIALSVVSACIADIDSTRYKPLEIDWHDDNGSNRLFMVCFRLIATNDSCYECVYYRSYGSPKPEIKPTYIILSERRTFARTRRIPFDSLRPLILANIEKMKRQIPEGNRFKSVGSCSVDLSPKNTLRHSITLSLGGRGSHTRKVSRRQFKTDYRQMYGLMDEGGELRISIADLKK